MINKILNWIKNIFKPEKQDPHIVLYEEVKTEPEIPIYNNKLEKINKKHKKEKE